MSLALARKHRPQSFAEVIGQEAVVRTLGNAIALKRVHHAYLFCGARGVGKTSLARIFAKSLNCENGPTAEPCQKCGACVAITTGRSLDVIEIDAASNTGVDNVRELREQVKFLPSEGRYKIYIVDEVHMLSGSAFNALLKTLEEPPAHVIFILATTEPHKIPITILSRCQRFDCRKMPVALLAEHLQNVIGKEQIPAEPQALKLVADAAQGSVRDALSLLDQVIGYAAGEITEQKAREVLGFTDRVLIRDAVLALARGDLQASLEKLTAADEKGFDLKTFAEEILLGWHVLTLAAAGSPPADPAPLDVSALAEFKNADAARLVAQHQILFRAVQDVAHTDFQKMALEVAFLKVVRAAEFLDLATLTSELKNRAAGRSAAPSASPVPMTRPTASAGASPQSQPAYAAPSVAEVAKPIAATGTAGPLSEDAWFDFVRMVVKVKPPLGGMLRDAVPVNLTAAAITVGLSPTSPAKNFLIERKVAVEEFLATHFHRPIAFVVTDLDGEKKKP